LHPNDAGHLLIGQIIISNLPPAIRAQPQSLSIAAGKPASFTITATGAAPVRYQWFRNGSELADGGNVTGSTTTSLSLAGVQPGDAGYYQAIVTNGGGAATSTVAILTVTQPPVILSSPSSRSADAGTNVSFQVSASGAPPLSFWWFRNGTNTLSDSTNVSGSSTATLALASVLGSDSGVYTVMITNASGAITSAPATLTVNDPLITSQPASRTNHAGTDAAFSIGVAGSPAAFQWFRDGVPATGATGQVLLLPAVTFADAAGYNVLVSNSYGSLLSATGWLSVSSPLLIQSLTLTNGTAAVTWNAIPGYNYFLQSKDSFDDPAWTSTFPALTATGALATATNSVGSSTQRFYRVFLGP
jgi:hypothetical protein